MNKRQDNKSQELVDQLMKLHRCADCPIRCKAVEQPRSLFARIHRWHRTWWPGWRIYLTELHGTGERVAAQS